MTLKKLFVLLSLALAPAGFAGPTNAILFVTQMPIAAGFGTIASTFGNHRGEPEFCGRGGDLYIRYPNGALKNLTRAAGYGHTGLQDSNSISVRQPSVYWNGQKAIFSMVVGAPSSINDFTPFFWQIYEITNFTNPNSTPVITKVANQPTNFNNVAPIYGTDDRIIFASDRPRNGAAHLYPQLDEYEELATVTGLWSLQPTNGDLFIVTHTPSGAFSPQLDSAGRIVYVRWDHLQRDQQADEDWEEGNHNRGTFNWSDESSNSVPTTDQTEVFPEPREVRTDLLAGTGLLGTDFNQFFPWAINQDGTDEETVNHVGRHELGGSYANVSFTNDNNLIPLDVFPHSSNTNVVHNFLEIREDPRTPGLYYGVDCPEFATHSAGQLVSLSGATNINPDNMVIHYLTPASTKSGVDTLDEVQPDQTGLYRNPLMTTDGYLISSVTTNLLSDVGEDTVYYPDTNYPSSIVDFRLKFMVLSNGFYVGGTPLTSGFTNNVRYFDSEEYIFDVVTNGLWELDPVEVVARTRPAPLETPIAAPELAAFAAADVDVADFQKYLRTHELALIVSRDVTTRDEADRQQPFNLKIAGTSHQTVGAGGKVYDIAWLQLFQADQLRSLNGGDTNNITPGRRVIAQNIHEPAVDNPPLPGAPLGSVRLGADGSQAAFVPARRAMSWQLTDTNGVGIVRERYWLTFASGEIRTCTSCHGINEKDQAGHPAPTNTPLALVQLLNYWKTNTTMVPARAVTNGTNHFQVTFVRRLAETGVTYHVQASDDLATWTDIATYSGTNITLTAQAAEVSRTGSPNESVTVRETAGIKGKLMRYLDVKVTRP